MKELLITAASVVVLQKVKPIEMIPVGFVKNNAAIFELGLGIVGTYGIMVKKTENPVLKGIAHGMVISGALKVIDKYVMKSK